MGKKLIQSFVVIMKLFYLVIGLLYKAKFLRAGEPLDLGLTLARCGRVVASLDPDHPPRRVAASVLGAPA
jgi:hypothetical protein